MSVVSSPLLRHRTGYWSGAFQRVEAAMFDVVDPATGQAIAALPMLSGPHALDALSAAARALAADVPDLPTRRRWLTEIAGAHLEHIDSLAAIITAENGKPIREAEGEVRYAASFYADAAQRLDILAPRTLPSRPRGCTWRVHARPAGVAGLITPFNFPLAMLAKKLSGAVAAGCPSVCKPAEKTPLSVVALFHLLDAMDLPPGFVNLVFGEPEPIGRAICEHPAVRVVSFTGSTKVGQWLAATCAPHMKRLALELGGNAPFVVFADADLDHAAEQLLANKMRASGQTCVCSNRVLVDEQVRDAFVERVQARVAGLVTGPGSDPRTDVGPLVDHRALQKVQAHVEDALAHGARLVAGGGRPALPPELAGSFIEPTILVGATPQMACFREETFGPLIAVGTFSSEEQAVRMAADTHYGLAAYLFSADLDRLERVAAQLRFGHVGLNVAAGPTPEAPFGGMRMSGLGREGGDEGILEFVEWQTTPTPAGPTIG